ncbi:serine/threonine protein kinase [Roseateles toxinivorans]|uniref:Serine/threonine protein kinase n=1 Tax=Roseateles toxinivorans TaxID=270368 RepID=A0A4R6QRN1_9BURK|nr:serine/threonine protein kinase [Roseateles toxinivorans]TDP74260.1 serine/threonine protein kinase [Roseateles toxinivorans]
MVAGSLIGRFKLLRPLGQGAQATVWLAHDPRLEREVAVKVLLPSEAPLSLDQWLHEARAVSRLTHPNIVPVFEADVAAGRPYMVFEYVPGLTLSDRQRRGPPLAVREAVELMLGVLEALQTAHQAGVVHRDLKPSNILLDASGRARVMDFGIAGRVAAPGSGDKPQRIVGTPGYMSPEAAQGRPPSPPMDVFAVALMLAELLSNQRMNANPDPWAAVKRVAEQDLSLPSGLPPAVDDKLRAIVQRGLARDPAQRWPTATAFLGALNEWLHAPLQAAPEAAGESATLEFLLRRMRHKSDFPALSDSVSRIHKVTSSENESLSALSNEILKDVALTNKLLRLVNTVQFSHAGGGSISTVSRAVALVGFAGIRNMALSVVLLERMENKAHAQQLKEDFLRSLMAGAVAGELCTVRRESEESFVAAMMQHLGRLLTEFYFPEEALQIRQLVRPAKAGSGAKAMPVNEQRASNQVLGLSYEDLGVGVAKQWGLPDSLQRSMRRPQGDPPRTQVDNPVERMRMLSSAANDVADAILHSEPSDAHARVRAVAERYGRALGLSQTRFEVAADEARQRLSEMAIAMDLKVPKHSHAQRLLAPVIPVEQDSLSPHELQATMVGDDTLVAEPHIPREQVAEILAAGIQDITNAMVESFKLNEVLRMILETMFRGLGFKRIIFCLRDPKTETLTGRFGLGEGVELIVPHFKVPLRTPPGVAPDLFAAICQKGVDTLIADASSGKIAERLPPWYLQHAKAWSFLILPMAVKGAPFAMIYADKLAPGSIDLGEKELSLLRTLRNQAVMAFKQSS